MSLHQRDLEPFKGFKMEFDLDYEDDNVKIFHFLVYPDGHKEFLDFSPYFNVPQEAFNTWIDLGMPPAREFGYLWGRGVRNFEYQVTKDGFLLQEKKGA